MDRTGEAATETSYTKKGVKNSRRENSSGNRWWTEYARKPSSMSARGKVVCVHQDLWLKEGTRAWTCQYTSLNWPSPCNSDCGTTIMDRMKVSLHIWRPEGLDTVFYVFYVGCNLGTRVQSWLLVTLLKEMRLTRSLKMVEQSREFSAKWAELYNHGIQGKRRWQHGGSL